MIYFGLLLIRLSKPHDPRIVLNRLTQVTWVIFFLIDFVFKFYHLMLDRSRIEIHNFILFYFYGVISLMTRIAGLTG